MTLSNIWNFWHFWSAYRGCKDSPVSKVLPPRHEAVSFIPVHPHSGSVSVITAAKGQGEESFRSSLVCQPCPISELQIHEQSCPPKKQDRGDGGWFLRSFLIPTTCEPTLTPNHMCAPQAWILMYGYSVKKSLNYFNWCQQHVQCLDNRCDLDSPFSCNGFCFVLFSLPWFPKCWNYIHDLTTRLSILCNVLLKINSFDIMNHDS